MADENRTVSVSLQLIYDPRSARAFQQMATESAKAAKAVNKQVMSDFAKGQGKLFERSGIASNLGQYGFANSLGRSGSQAEGLHALGFSGAAKFAQRAAVPLAIAGAVADGAQKVAGYAYDRYSTNAQIGRQAVRDFVPGGERIQKFADAMSGRTADYEQADIRSQQLRAETANRRQVEAFDLGQNPRQAGLNATAAAYKGGSAVTGSVFDRSTAAGEKAFRDEQRILPLKQAEAKAERDAAAAIAERKATQEELNKLITKGSQLQSNKAWYSSRLGMDDYQSGGNRQGVLKNQAVNLEDIAANAQQQQDARRRLMDAQGRATGAGAELNKARLRTDLIGRADKLGSEGDTAAATESRIGGMSQFDRAFGLQAARLIKSRGSADGLPPEYIQAAMQIAPQEIGKLIQKTGADSDTVKAIQAEFPTDYKGNSSDLYKKEAELRKQAGEGEYAIDAGSAAALAKQGADFGRFIQETFKTMLDAAKGEIMNAIRIGRNAS